MAEDRLKTVFRHIRSTPSSSGHINFWPTAAVYQSLSNPATQFVYTLDNPLLTHEQRVFYEENGYLVIPKLVPHDLLDVFKTRFINLCRGHIPKGMMTLMKDISLAKMNAKDENLYNKIQDFVWDDVLSQYIHLKQILDYVECFTGPNIMAVHTMLINKPPDAGTKTSRHPLHQDLHYFPFRPANRIVASWTAMEKTFHENGCLVVLPGSHTGELLPHEYPEWKDGVNKMFYGIRGFRDSPVVHLEMEKGDTVFFHPLLIHGSGTNKTKGYRKAISCHYAASECEYIDVHGTSQENIAREVDFIIKKKGFNTKELDYKDIWKFRSHLVRGEMISL